MFTSSCCLITSTYFPVTRSFLHLDTCPFPCFALTVPSGRSPAAFYRSQAQHLPSSSPHDLAVDIYPKHASIRIACSGLLNPNVSSNPS